MKDIMLDLETMGTGNNAAIVSIGAVLFDIDTGDIGSEFYMNVDLKSCMEAGLDADGDTICWWMKQSDEARMVLLENTKSLEDACTAFGNWVRMVGKKAKLWGNGVAFDNVILRNAFNKAGVKFPVHFRNDMDVRTLVAYDPEEKKKQNSEREGTAHNALDDAKHQVKYVSAIHRRLKKCKKLK